MQEIRVGETFVHEGKKLKCKVGGLDNCRYCAFFENSRCWMFPCTPAGRTDGRIVYFEEVKDGKC